MGAGQDAATGGATSSLVRMAHGMGPGILSGPVDEYGARGAKPRRVPAVAGTVVTHLASHFRGTVVRVDAAGVVLRAGESGLERHFPLRSGDFLVDGVTVTLVPGPGQAAKPAGPAKTASGSIAVPGARARVARPSRLMVEGIHDAELVEKVWGDDLRVDGVVVERLDGIDNLADILRVLPAPEARLGVLVDHLVPGSKEQRLATELSGPTCAFGDPVRRRVAGRPAVGVGHNRLAFHPARTLVEGGRLRRFR